MTVPNILREFNPRLKGFSTGNSKSGIRGLNLGMDNAVSSDLESQVEELISKIKRNPNLSLRDDWKVREFFFKYRNSKIVQITYYFENNNFS